MYERALSQQSHLLALYNLLKKHPYNAYLLVNTIQQGQAKMQVQKSNFFKMPNANTQIINWVSQSIYICEEIIIRYRSSVKIGENSTSSILQISEEELLILTKTYPEVAITLLQKGLLKKAASTI